MDDGDNDKGFRVYYKLHSQTTGWAVLGLPRGNGNDNGAYVNDNWSYADNKDGGILGTIMVGQDTGYGEISNVRMYNVIHDPLNAGPTGLQGTPYGITSAQALDPGGAYMAVQASLDSARPVVLMLDSWSTGIVQQADAAGIEIYNLHSPVPVNTDLEEQYDADNFVGHAVLAVGHFAWQGAPYVIVLDNDHTTPQHGAAVEQALLPPPLLPPAVVYGAITAIA